jgi:hypothetical protein
MAIGTALLVGLATAYAEDPPANPPGAAGVDAPDEEITVWSERVRHAREAVEKEVLALGYDRVRPKDGRTVFVNDTAYKGKVVLFDDGRLETHRTGPRGRALDPIAGTRIRPYFLCAVVPTLCLEAGSWYVAERRWRQTEDAVAEATAKPLVTLGDRLADQALATRLHDLPDQLDALWTRGTPVDGSTAILATYRERRAALLAFWDTRTETPWGNDVRAGIESFVRAEVQASDHPFTPAEIAAFDEVRTSATPFPW